MLADILAHGSRIGVFSENESLLATSIQAVFQQPEVEVVSIYNRQGKLLREQRAVGVAATKRTAEGTEGDDILSKLEELSSSLSSQYIDSGESMEFWSLVTISSTYPDAESLIIADHPQPTQKRVIGIARIIVGKAALNRRLNVMMANSVLIGFVFLVLGCIIIYILTIRITRPLNRLTSGVQMLGEGNLGEKVSVETEDEIGRLALAFNQMSASLQKRETEKTQLEAQLRLSQRMEAIGSIAGGIAHDFNNVLATIMGYAQMGRLPKADEGSMKNHFKEIIQACYRARDLVVQILVFSRRQKLELHPALIQPTVEESLGMLKGPLPDAVTIQQEYEPGLHYIMSNATQVHQIVDNLGRNAIHAMTERGGTLSVKLCEIEIGEGDPRLSNELQPGRHQLLEISDTGHGIPDTIKDSIFDPFFTTKEPGKGTGMGLSVVHGIVKSHGGKIEFDSTPATGTEFRIYFPVHKEGAEQTDAAPSVTRPENILFVDDEQSLVTIGTKLLQSLGFSVVGKTDGIDALEAFQSDPDQFDLIITDNMMPKLTGLELAREVKRKRPDLPIIVCTGFSHTMSDSTIEEHGIDALVTKPLTSEGISATIEEVFAE